jgi:LPS-assembly protein
MSRAALVLTCLVAALALPAVARAQSIQCKTGSMKNDPGESIDVKPGVTRRTFKNVTIYCDDETIYADEMVDQSDSDTVTLTGNVEFEETGFHVFADHAIVNRKTHLGTFYQAQGTASLPPRPGQAAALFGSFEPDIIFWGDELSKVGDRKYHLVNGGFTSCVQPSPRWEFTTTAGTITLDKHVLLKNPVLRVKDVPVFYLPAIYYPINHDGRNTGFLMPQYGTSTIGGFTLSNAFFWALGRSQDATFYHDYGAKSGQGFTGEYRYVQSPSSRGNARFQFFNQKPLLDANGNSIGLPSQTYRVTGSVNQTLAHGFMLTANSNYSSSVQTNQLYQQDIYNSTNRSSTIDAQLSGSIKRLRTTASFDLADTYGITGDITSASRRGYAPKLDLQLASKPIGHTKIYFGMNGQAAYAIRQDQVGDPTTDHSLLRFDGGPTVTAPLSSLTFLQVNTSANWRLTEWGESLDDNGKQVSVPITRQLLRLSTTLKGPSFEKVFNGQTWKHLIEPNVGIDWVSNFQDFARIVQIDGTDTIVGGTTTVNYGLTNTLYAKRQPNAALAAAAGASMPPSQTMQILSVGISQSYYTNAQASQYDAQYQTAGLAPPSKFSPISVSANATPTQRTSAQFRMDIDPQFRKPRNYSVGGGLNFTQLHVNAGWSRRLVIPNDPGFDETQASNYLNQTTTFTRPDGKVGVTYGFNYDVRNKLWLQQRVVAFYNSQCCGVSINYSSADISQYNLAAPTNHQFAISFTLAGLGSFSNPFGSFGVR